MLGKLIFSDLVLRSTGHKESPGVIDNRPTSGPILQAYEMYVLYHKAHLYVGSHTIKLDMARNERTGVRQKIEQ